VTRQIPSRGYVSVRRRLLGLSSLDEPSLTLRTYLYKVIVNGSIIPRNGYSTFHLLRESVPGPTAPFLLLFWFHASLGEGEGTRHARNDPPAFYLESPHIRVLPSWEELEVRRGKRQHRTARTDKIGRNDETTYAQHAVRRQHEDILLPGAEGHRIEEGAQEEDPRDRESLFI
jgi:hypothetical protein